MVADRRRDIRLLIGSRFDGVPVPSGGLRASSGFVPTSFEPCSSCAGLGRVVDRYGRRSQCSRCGGRGRLAFDRMDSLHVPVGADETVASARPRRTVECDSCGGDGAFGNGRRCDVCDGVGKVDEHLFELSVAGEDDADPVDVLDRWEAALKRRRESGSYAELDAALLGLIHHVNKPVEWRWVTEYAARAISLLDELWLHRVKLLEDLRVDELALVSAAESYLDWRMPERIVVPRDVRLNEKKLVEHRKLVKGRHLNGGGGPAVERRRSEICKLIRAGKPTQWVAAEYGLSVSQVNRIVSGRAEDAA